MNFSKEIKQMKLPVYKNDWKKIFDSAEPKWKGPSAAHSTITSNSEITLQPESFLIYKNNNV
jgi:maltooligosyltrehalose trehalohydrolase